MIVVTSVLTLHLAKAIGIYAIAAGLSGLLMPRRWMEIVDGLRRDPALIYVTGAFTFALGAAIVLAHNLWRDPLALLVTAIGWAAAIEGLILIAFPEPLLRLATNLVRPGATRVFSIVALVLGVALLIAGLLGRAGPL